MVVRGNPTRLCPHTHLFSYTIYVHTLEEGLGGRVLSLPSLRDISQPPMCHATMVPPGKASLSLGGLTKHGQRIPPCLQEWTKMMRRAQLDQGVRSERGKGGRERERDGRRQSLQPGTMAKQMIVCQSQSQQHTHTDTTTEQQSIVHFGRDSYHLFCTASAAPVCHLHPFSIPRSSSFFFFFFFFFFVFNLTLFSLLLPIHLVTSCPPKLSSSEVVSLV